MFYNDNIDNIHSAKERKFYFEQLEFSREKNYDKFLKNNKNIKFKNGSSMSKWFYNNIDTIFNLNYDVSKDIIIQYKNYNSNFMLKLKDFLLENSPLKYNKKDNTLKFNDGYGMSKWFYDNEKRIKEFDLELYEKLLLKRKESNNIVHLTFEEKMDEFLNCNYEYKFNILCDLKFSDGNYMYTFYALNKKYIFENNSPKYIKLRRQYKKYRRNLKNK